MDERINMTDHIIVNKKQTDVNVESYWAYLEIGDTDFEVTPMIMYDIRKSLNVNYIFCMPSRVYLMRGFAKQFQHVDVKDVPPNFQAWVDLCL